MADPQTGQVGLYLPTRGSDSGTWDLPENANDSATDNLFANVATISLTNANVTLTTPPNSGASWSGPYQSQSAILKFTGTLTGNCTITIPRAGFFIVDNTCTVGAFYVALASSAPGNIICAPPGEAVHVYCDGVNMRYVDLGRVGSYLDLGASAVPAWITNCTVQPYLNCDGSVFSAVTYPQLAAYLGGTTLPDARGRGRIALNQTTGRNTNANGYGIDGNTLLANGGKQTIDQANLPNVSLNITSLTGNYNYPFFRFATATSGGDQFQVNNNTSTSTPISGGGGTVALGGSGFNFAPPGYVGGLTLIRAG